MMGKELFRIHLHPACQGQRGPQKNGGASDNVLNDICTEPRLDFDQVNRRFAA